MIFHGRMCYWSMISKLTKETRIAQSPNYGTEY